MGGPAASHNPAMQRTGAAGIVSVVRMLPARLRPLIATTLAGQASTRSDVPFYICNGNGESADSPTAEIMRKFLADLDPADEEHGAAWVADDEGNALEYEVGGNLSFSRSDQTRHLPQVSIHQVVALWEKLAAGQFDELEREPWQPGSRPPLSAEARDARERMFADAQRAQDRTFYDGLGAERPTIPCRADRCTRGSVELSVFCRRHHFESVMGRPCPFAPEAG
jgi:hypothetical protein